MANNLISLSSSYAHQNKKKKKKKNGSSKGNHPSLSTTDFGSIFTLSSSSVK